MKRPVCSYDDPFYVETPRQTAQAPEAAAPRRRAWGTPAREDVPRRAGERIRVRPLDGIRAPDGRMFPHGTEIFGGLRTPWAHLRRRWKDIAEDIAHESATRPAGMTGMTSPYYKPGEVLTRGEAMRRYCAAYIKGTRERLATHARGRWDLPDVAFSARRLDRIWMLEAELCDCEDFLELLDEMKADDPAKMTARDSYMDACLKESRDFDWTFPVLGCWPSEDVEALRSEVSEARWTLRALKAMHRLGLDPKTPKTLDGQTLARKSAEGQPRMDGNALKRGLQALLPKNWDADAEAEAAAASLSAKGAA